MLTSHLTDYRTKIACEGLTADDAEYLASLPLEELRCDVRPADRLVAIIDAMGLAAYEALIERIERTCDKG